MNVSWHKWQLPKRAKLAPQVCPRSSLLTARVCHPACAWTGLTTERVGVAMSKPAARGCMACTPRSPIVVSRYGKEATETVWYNNALTIPTPLWSQALVRRVAAQWPTSRHGRSAACTLGRYDGGKDPVQLVQALGVDFQGLVEHGWRRFTERTYGWCERENLWEFGITDPKLSQSWETVGHQRRGQILVVGCGRRVDLVAGT